MREGTDKILWELIRRRPELESSRDSIEAAVKTILNCYDSGGKLLICGNGGSAADSEHIVGELMKGFLLERPISREIGRKIDQQAEAGEVEATFSGLQRGLPAISLVNQGALQTAIINDIGADMIFAQQVLGYGREGDILIAISTSGESLNVVKAACVARALKMEVIAMTGEKQGSLAKVSDILINVPGKENWQIQELHLPVYHGICAAVEYEMFGGVS